MDDLLYAVIPYADYHGNHIAPNLLREHDGEHGNLWNGTLSWVATLIEHVESFVQFIVGDDPDAPSTAAVHADSEATKADRESEDFVIVPVPCD